MENVRNFVNHDGGRTLAIVRGTMEELGYDVYYKVLNAADYGVPQTRERVYIVCFRKDLEICEFGFPEPIELRCHVEDMLLEDDFVQELYVERQDLCINDVMETSNKPIRIGTVDKGCQGYRIYSTKGTAITLSAYGGGIFAKTGGYLVNGKIRKLHPRECARLMGFPDTYRICERANQAYKQFGNSVVIDVLQRIGIEIGNVLNREGKDS